MPGILEFTFDNYKDVDGVQFANKSSVEVSAQGITITYEYETTELNGEIDATKFDTP